MLWVEDPEIARPVLKAGAKDGQPWFELPNADLVPETDQETIVAALLASILAALQARKSKASGPGGHRNPLAS